MVVRHVKPFKQFPHPATVPHMKRLQHVGKREVIQFTWSVIAKKENIKISDLKKNIEISDKKQQRDFGFEKTSRFRIKKHRDFGFEKTSRFWIKKKQTARQSNSPCALAWGANVACNLASSAGAKLVGKSMGSR